MRVCLVTFDFPPRVGGISTQAYDLASHLASEELEVHVLTAGNKDEKVCNGDLFKETRLKVPLRSKLRKIPTFQFKVWQWLRNNRKGFDIIHFEEGAGFIYFLVSFLYRKGKNNTIEHFHHSHVAEFLFHLKSLFRAPKENIPYLFMPLAILQEYFSLRRAKKVITVSNSSRSTLLRWGINPSKIAVIPNALSELFFRDSGQKSLSRTIKFLYVGRLVPRKGVDILIEAAKILKNRGIDNFYIDIVGQGPLFNYCQKMIEKNDLKNCHMWGLIPQEKLDELYLKADCFICPSRLEGFGIVLLEAASNDLAIIANDIPVFREIYSDKEALYFKQNDPDSLVEKMLQLINNPNQISALRTKARRKAENYNWQNVIKSYVALYSKISQDRKEG